MKVRDVNYKEITIGCTVDVPKVEDNVDYEFRGTVVGFHGDYVVVEDIEEESFCVEPEILEVVED